MVRRPSTVIHKLVLAIIACLFIGFGGVAWLDPVATVSPLAIELTAPQALTEIRATYGGLMIGIGLVFAGAAIKTEMTRFGLLSAAIMLTLIGLTRLYGIVADGSASPLLWQLLAVELVPATLAWCLLLKPTANSNASGQL